MNIQNSPTLDLLIQNARLRGQDSPVAIGIADGRIASIGEVRGEADLVLDAGGNLVTETFVNPHLHLCKVYTRQMMAVLGTASTDSLRSLRG